jgi:hypothetical protein
MPAWEQKWSSAGKKLSPGSNRTPNVRPTVSTWLCMGVVPFPVRLLLHVLLANGTGHDELRNVFAAYDGYETS